MAKGRAARALTAVAAAFAVGALGLGSAYAAPDPEDLNNDVGTVEGQQSGEDGTLPVLLNDHGNENDQENGDGNPIVRDGPVVLNGEEMPSIGSATFVYPPSTCPFETAAVGVLGQIDNWDPDSWEEGTEYAVWAWAEPVWSEGSPLVDEQVYVEEDGSFSHTFGTGFYTGEYYGQVVLSEVGVGPIDMTSPIYFTVEYSDDCPTNEVVFAEVAFDPAKVEVCAGEKVEPKITGRITGWDPEVYEDVLLLVDFEFYVDYDAEGTGDFELLEEVEDLEVAADGSFSYTFKSVGVGDYNTDVWLWAYSAQLERYEFLGAEFDVLFKVTEKDCSTPVTPEAKPAQLADTGANAVGTISLLGLVMVGAGIGTLALRRRT